LFNLQDEREGGSDDDVAQSEDEGHQPSRLGKRKPPNGKVPKQRPEKRSKSMSNFFHTVSWLNVHYLSEGPRVEVEYENELESVPLSKSTLASW